MTEHRHMSWCAGAHTSYQECVIEHQLRGDELTVALTGVPCDNATVQIDGIITTPDELAAVLKAAGELFEPFVNSQVEVDCDLHPDWHPDDVDDPDEYEDDVPCTGCGALDTSLLGVGDEWLCSTCCAARGIEYSGSPR